MKLVKLDNKLTSYHVNFRMNYFMCLLYSFVYFSMFCNIRGKKIKKNQWKLVKLDKKLTKVGILNSDNAII